MMRACALSQVLAGHSFDEGAPLVYAQCVAKVADMPSGAPFLLQGCSELVRAHGRRGDFLEVPICVENVSSYASFTLQR